MSLMALTEIIGVLGAIEKVEGDLEKIGAGRSVIINLENHSNYTLIYLSSQHGDPKKGMADFNHGGWGEPYPQQVPPNNAAVFSAVSKGIGSGTEGRIAYKATEHETVPVWWSNPWVGNNSGGANIGWLGPHTPFKDYNTINVTSVIGSGNSSKNKHEVWPIKKSS